MPAWWGFKSNSSKNKADHKSNSMKDPKGKTKHKSFDEISPNITSIISPTSRDSSNPNSFSGLDFPDSNSTFIKELHPLPRPFITSSLVPHEPVITSNSVSSVSSSNSSDEPPDLPGSYRYSDPSNTPSGRNSQPNKQRHQKTSREYLSTSPIAECKFPELSSPPRKDSQPNRFDASGNGFSPRRSVEIVFDTRSRSPSRTRRPEDGRSPCHPLPLPPSSPRSPIQHSMMSNGLIENQQLLRSKWKKGKLLGRGTFGHVYCGFNSESGQMCAIKEVHFAFDDQNSSECLKQLEQEIMFLSQLSHPNIVQYYGSELVDDTLSVYLEYVSGGSIHKLLQDYGPFKESLIRSYTAQIVSGLAYLHGRNTLHRDIKGANILVSTNGEVKLVDFGMAKHITSCTSILSFKGSPYWMAPEVIMNSSGYNLTVDIWSLGCTVLEMATSKPPWNQYEGVAAIFKIGNTKELPEIPEYISSDGKNFLKLCLQRDPSARPTAVQLLDHPFIRDQVPSKVVKLNVVTDSPVFPSDGNRSSRFVDLHQSKISAPLLDADYEARPTNGFHPYSSSRHNVNPGKNLSLPVSPRTGTLPQYGASNRNFYPSPTYNPTGTNCGGTGYNPNNHLGFSSRRETCDLWKDFPQLNIRTTPNTSPRRSDPYRVYL